MFSANDYNTPKRTLGFRLKTEEGDILEGSVFFSTGQADEDENWPMVRITHFKTDQYITPQQLGEWIEEVAELAVEVTQQDRQKAVMLHEELNGARCAVEKRNGTSVWQ
jgi:hypothetical protein